MYQECGRISWESKETVVSALGLPQDVIPGNVLVNFMDRSQVNVESYRSILIYTDTLIEPQARNYKVVIHGARLKAGYHTAGEVKITGQVGSLGFET